MSTAAIRAGYGFAATIANADNDDAIAAAVKTAVKTAAVERPSFAIITCTVDTDPDVVTAAFARELPGTPLHGATSGGAILGVCSVEASGVACLLFDAPPGAFIAVYGPDAKAAAAALKVALTAACDPECMLQWHTPHTQQCGGEDRYAVAGGVAMERFDRAIGPPGAILMCTVPGEEEGVLAALDDTFGPDVPVWGGTAADNELNGLWRVMTAHGAKAHGVSLVAVDTSKVKFGASMIGPYTETDLRATVTKATGRTVFELDDKPALVWATDWLGDAVLDQVKSLGIGNSDGCTILPVTADKPIAIFHKMEGSVDAGLQDKWSDESSTTTTTTTTTSTITTTTTTTTNNAGISSACNRIPTYLHLASLSPLDESLGFFAPVSTGDEIVVMDSGDGPATGYAACLSAAYDAAMKAGGLHSPKAGVLLYCGGMSIAVGPQLEAGLSANTFTAKVSTELPLLGMTVFGEQANIPELGNVQQNLTMGFLLFE